MCLIFYISGVWGMTARFLPCGYLRIIHWTFTVSPSEHRSERTSSQQPLQAKQMVIKYNSCFIQANQAALHSNTAIYAALVPLKNTFYFRSITIPM